MSKVIACVIARTVSTRLPLKVLRHVRQDVSMIEFILRRLKNVAAIDNVILCTSTEAVDDILEDIALAEDVGLYRGCADEVIERLVAAGESHDATHVIRVTGDNVFVCSEFLERQIAEHIANDLDYSRIAGLPLGGTAEVIRLEALKHCYENMDPSVSEYLVLYMFNPDIYKCGVFRVKELDKLDSMSLTVDTPEDLVRTRAILEQAGAEPDEVTLAGILKAIRELNIEHAEISDDVQIKMPYDETTSYGEFRQLMAERESKSLTLMLEYN